MVQVDLSSYNQLAREQQAAINDDSVPLVLNGVRLFNLKRFYDFIKGNAKYDSAFDAYIDDFIEQDGVKGNPDGHSDYELSSYEAKSGRTELIGYFRETELDDDDNVKITFTF